MTERPHPWIRGPHSGCGGRNVFRRTVVDDVDRRERGNAGRVAECLGRYQPFGDARTDEDITRQVLGQIIFEEENKGQHLLPIQFLRQLIRFYGDSLQAFVPSYLEISMDSFAKNQNDIRKKFADALGGKLGYREFEQLTRQNMQMLERAMRMFSPFGGSHGSLR